MTAIATGRVVVLARRLVDELVKGEQLEVRRASALAADLAAYVETLKRPPSGVELEDWLGDHKQVEELYASRTVLETLSDRYFRPPPAAGAPVASQPDLERELRDAPNDEPHAYLVYADWLQERGDPFGELIALGVAATGGDAAARTRFEAFLEQHEKLFLRGIKNALGSLVELRWHNGFITHVGESNNPMGLANWRRLFDLRVASLVRSIVLCQPLDPEIDALIAERATALRELRVRHGKLPAVLLERAQLHTLGLAMVQVRLDATTLPAKLVGLELQVRELERAEDLTTLGIRELVLRGGMWRVPVTTFGSLAGLALPDLERLELDGLDGTLAAMCDRVLAHLAMPKLTSLIVRRAEGVRAADLARLVALPCIAQLRRLALQDLAVTDASLAALAPLAAHALAELDIDGNELTPAGVARAKTFAATVVVGKQRAEGATALDAIRTFAAGRLAAGEAIADPAAWQSARITDDTRWARYVGGSEYELYVTTDLSRYSCTCPSAYQPCKHVIALALVAARGPLPTAPEIGIPVRG